MAFFYFHTSTLPHKKKSRYYDIGGRAYPVRHYPIAIRLRDRKGRAILCIALFPSEWGLFGRNTRSAIQGTSSRKCYGKDAKGRPFYGPGETYIYHCHEGEWSEGAKKNRSLFQEVQLLAKQELEDPERVAYWQPLFEKQFKHPKQGEKHYATLRGFVIAQIHQQLKKQKAG